MREKARFLFDRYCASDGISGGNAPVRPAPTAAKGASKAKSRDKPAVKALDSVSVLTALLLLFKGKRMSLLFVTFTLSETLRTFGSC